MATLTRLKTETHSVATTPLSSSVPAPFPREQYLQIQQDNGILEQTAQPHAGPSHISETEAEAKQHSIPLGALHDLMPSIISVQKSCLMALNNLLSVSTKWSPIVPGRRHSMPSVPEMSLDLQTSSSPALQTLVANLRNRDNTDHMIECHAIASDDELIYELRTRVEHISSSLELDDAQLANSLVSLLSHLNRLSGRAQISSAHAVKTLTGLAPSEATGPSDLFNVLKRQLNDLQTERVSLKPDILNHGTPPVQAVESTLLWHRIDEDLETVVSLCKKRSESLYRLQLETLPPEYDRGDYTADALPDYDEGSSRISIDSAKSWSVPHSPPLPSRHADEKMRMDLENVTMAIDRLYMVAPQLHNQRVELKTSKLAQMEQASRTQTPRSRTSKQKQKEIDELDQLFNLLSKASERKLNDQVVTLDDNVDKRREKVRRKDITKKDQFVEQLALHSSAGRLHQQDATFASKVKDPNALLSLPEFIREPVPSRPHQADPSAMLTLPEFVKEPLPVPQEDTSSQGKRYRSKKKLRHRSSSAPSLSWLFPSPSFPRVNSLSNSSSHRRSQSRNVGRSSPPSLPINVFEIHHIAENRENLRHIIVFFTLTGGTPGVDIEAEVPVPSPESDEHQSTLIIHSGPSSSPPLRLPAIVLPGPQVVRVQGNHYEIKIPTVPPTTPADPSVEDRSPLLDAMQLTSASPTSFICASCSLPLIHSTNVTEYRDLPSEHWAELVDAWMCHTDQRLHDHIVTHSKSGFWPKRGEVLVGGSYILFEESAAASHNIHVEETRHGEEWRLVRCLCGAVIGRCQQHRDSDSFGRRVYRLLKFAIRPVSQSTPPFRIPLSAFIAQDMIELVQAHASYRFVILDEEEEVPRILVWLFKPTIRLSYTTSIPYLIPKSGSIVAAKVLYKILSPPERTKDFKDTLNRYPGFPQAEYLFYPLPICRRLAQLLRESNSTYPPGMQEMMNMRVGWLSRT